jgi:hypothetical protein
MRLAAIALVVFFTSCHRQKGVVAPAYPDPVVTVDTVVVEAPKEVPVAASADTLLCYIERTPCFGQCPSYKAWIYTTGLAVYEGGNFVERLGPWRAQISNAVLDEIRSQIVSVNYFDWNDSYDAKVTDVPTTYTEVHLNGQKKKIMNRFNGPAGLKQFERYLDGVLNAQKWEKLPEEDK